MSHAVGSRHKVASNGIDILTFSIPYVLLPYIIHFNITATQTHKTLLVTPKEMSPVNFEHFPDSDMRIIGLGWIDINSIGFTTHWLNMVLIKVLFCYNSSGGAKVVRGRGICRNRDDYPASPAPPTPAVDCGKDWNTLPYVQLFQIWVILS